MTPDAPPIAIAALVYAAGTDPGPMLRELAARLAAKGATCAGFIQRDTVRPGQSRCDMVLEDIRSGVVIPISQDRGPGARGCQLDETELTRAMMACAEALQSRPDVLFINKFGKSEAEGRGFRPLIADALEREIPVLIAVSWANIDSWRCFAADFALEIPIEQAQTEIDMISEKLCFGTPAQAKCVRPAAAAPGSEMRSVENEA